MAAENDTLTPPHKKKNIYIELAYETDIKTEVKTTTKKKRKRKSPKKSNLNSPTPPKKEKKNCNKD